MSKINEEDILEKIRQSGCFFIPRGAYTTELHMAAFMHLPRRTVVEAFFHPEAAEGASHMEAGPRKVCTSDAVADLIERQAKPHGKSRRGGNRQCRASRTSSGSK